MLTRDKGSQEDFLSMFHTPSKELQSFRSKYMDPISSSVLARLLRRLYVSIRILVRSIYGCTLHTCMYNNLAAPDPIAWALGTPSLSFKFMCAV